MSSACFSSSVCVCSVYVQCMLSFTCVLFSPSPSFSLVIVKLMRVGEVNMTLHTEKTQFIERLLRRDSFILLLLLLLLIFTEKYRTSRWKKLLTFWLVFVGPSVCVFAFLLFIFLHYGPRCSITTIGRSYLCANVCVCSVHLGLLLLLLLCSYFCLLVGLKRTHICILFEGCWPEPLSP